jgi:hypothetical protein
VRADAEKTLADFRAGAAELAAVRADLLARAEHAEREADAYRNERPRCVRAPAPATVTAARAPRRGQRTGQAALWQRTGSLRGLGENGEGQDGTV